MTQQRSNTSKSFKKSTSSTKHSTFSPDHVSYQIFNDFAAVFKWHNENLEPNKPDPLETSKLRILAVTWNMMGLKPTELDYITLLNPAGAHHDIYAIGSQESVETIFNSMLKPSKQLIVDLCSKVLGREYFMVHSLSLQATHLVVFASIRLASVISGVSSKDVTLGFGKYLGNKGACSISLNIGKTKLNFITCHLHSGQDVGETRNEGLVDILDKLMPTNQIKKG
jgi:hypothetical protein